MIEKIVFCVSAALLFSSADIDIAAPDEREFIKDSVDMISAESEERIREICDHLLTDTQIPIVVVTIESMAAHGGAGMDIESFARLLFNSWGVGFEHHNYGILLLVSKEDRRARIELGADWDPGFYSTCAEIMDGQIVPRFKAGDFSKGIEAGVNALDKMARGLPLPRHPIPWWYYLVGAGAIGLIVFTIVSLIRRGASGWAWLFWGGLFAFLGYLLYTMNRNQRRGGIGFGGGSFGGGFSGGGSATGSW